MSTEWFYIVAQIFHFPPEIQLVDASVHNQKECNTLKFYSLIMF